MRKALGAELKNIGITRFGIGTRITVELTGFRKNEKGKPTKLFNVTVVPTDWVAPDVQATEAALADSEPAAAGAPVEEKVGSPADLTAALALLNGPAKPVITKEMVDMVGVLLKSNIDRATAVAAVATKFDGDDAFKAALEAEIPF